MYPVASSASTSPFPLGIAAACAALGAVACAQIAHIPEYAECIVDEDCPQPAAGSCKHALCDAATRTCVEKTHGFHVKSVELTSHGDCSNLHPNGCLVVAEPYLFLVGQDGIVAYDIRAPATEKPLTSVQELPVEAQAFDITASRERLWAVGPTSKDGQTQVWWTDVTSAPLGRLQTAVLPSSLRRENKDGLVAVSAERDQPALILRMIEDMAPEPGQKDDLLLHLALLKVTADGSHLTAPRLDTDTDHATLRAGSCTNPSLSGVSVSGARVVLSQDKHLSVVPYEQANGLSAACLGAFPGEQSFFLAAAADDTGAVAGAAFENSAMAGHNYLKVGWLLNSSASMDSNHTGPFVTPYETYFDKFDFDTLSMAMPTDQLLAVAAPANELLRPVASGATPHVADLKTQILVYENNGVSPKLVSQRRLILSAPSSAVKLAAHPNTTYVYVYSGTTASQRRIDVLDLACDDPAP